MLLTIVQRLSETPIKRKTMKKLSYFIAAGVYLVCIPFVSRAQFQDDFSDGNLTANPAWMGDTGLFEVNSTAQLHLNASGSDTAVLMTRSNRISDTEWHFWVKLSFNTSSNNFARVYLAGDTNVLISNFHGYFLQLGGSDDSISFVKQSGSTITTLYRFKLYKTFHSTNTLRIKIIRNEAGWWEAGTDTTGGHNFSRDGSFFDNSFTTTRWFGIFCRYTSSNSTKFYFDDFYAGPIIRDTIPPKLLEVEALSERLLSLTFTEPLTSLSALNPENYRIASTASHPDSVQQEPVANERITIYFHEPLHEGQIDSLRLTGLSDLSGNRMADTIVPVCFRVARPYDVVINEILADPDPPVDMINAEFVELHNRTAFPVNLGNWSFQYGSYSKVFPSLLLPPGGFLLICKDSAWLHVAPCAVLFTSSTSLSNEGTTLVLRDSQGHVVHTITYGANWFRGSFKEDGGWSLEMVDVGNPCGCMENWEPSKDASGGTPGRSNSVSRNNPDETTPEMKRAVIADSNCLSVTFSESMDSLSLLPAISWQLTPGSFSLLAVKPIAPDFKTVDLCFGENFLPGIIYGIRFKGHGSDCAGNEADTSLMVRFAIPEEADSVDLVINEVLSNPVSGGVRFVELYNRSDKIIDLQTLQLSDHDPSGGGAEVATSGRLIFPEEYALLTSDPDKVSFQYSRAVADAMCQMPRFPVFDDDTGTVILARRDNQVIIDRMKYRREMHYPLLASTEGVSLERSNPGWPSLDQDNWHSAAETAGYATPGYVNSHDLSSEGMEAGITISPEIFSPDNDGRDDLLMIHVREQEADCGVTIVIYDSGGRRVRLLANNVFTGSEGVFIWDGMTDAGTRARIGFYVILVELVWPDGTVRRVKRTVVAGGKF